MQNGTKVMRKSKTDVGVGIVQRQLTKGRVEVLWLDRRYHNHKSAIKAASLIEHSEQLEKERREALRAKTKSLMEKYRA